MKTAQLWVPGTDISGEYQALERHELAYEWSDYVQADAEPLQGVLGAIGPTLDAYAKVASIDLCEVVRETHIGLAGLVGKGREHIDHFGAYQNTLGVAKGHAAAITTIMMNEVGVAPVRDIAQIADRVRSWKSSGILTVANTSTLPGCEQVTVDFLKQHMPGCFDAIVFPRNFDGTGPFTKALALESVIAELDQTKTVEKIIHIDDAPHHIETMLKHMSGLATRSFLGIIPYYKGNEVYPEQAVSVPNPLAAFVVADTFLRIS